MKKRKIIFLLLLSLCLSFNGVGAKQKPVKEDKTSVAWLSCPKNDITLNQIKISIGLALWPQGFAAVYDNGPIVIYTERNSNFAGIKRHYYFNLYENSTNFYFSLMSSCTNGSSNITGLSNSPDCDNASDNMAFLRILESITTANGLMLKQEKP